jgi:hypothetical protein
VDIGKEKPAIIVEPIKDPFPKEAPTPTPAEPPSPSPEKQPAETPA